MAKLRGETLASILLASLLHFSFSSAIGDWPAPSPLQPVRVSLCRPLRYSRTRLFSRLFSSRARWLHTPQSLSWNWASGTLGPLTSSPGDRRCLPKKWGSCTSWRYFLDAACHWSRQFFGLSPHERLKAPHLEGSAVRRDFPGLGWKNCRKRRTRTTMTQQRAKQSRGFPELRMNFPRFLLGRVQRKPPVSSYYTEYVACLADRQ